jgi:hypothetical protein
MTLKVVCALDFGGPYKNSPNTLRGRGCCVFDTDISGRRSMLPQLNRELDSAVCSVDGQPLINRYYAYDAKVRSFCAGTRCPMDC